MSGATFIQTPAAVPLEASVSPQKSRLTSVSVSVTPEASSALPSVGEELISGGDPSLRSSGNTTTKPSVHFGNKSKPASPATQSVGGVGTRRRASVIGLPSPDGSRRASISPGSTLSGLNMLRGRRQSMWGGLAKRFTLPAGGMLREGTPEDAGRKTPAKLENTYKMKPSTDEQFNISKVEKEIVKVMADELEGVKYNPMEISILSKELCDKIKERVKGLGFCRHKLVVYMVMGSLLGQGMELSSRGMWDCNNDNYVSAKFQNDSIFAVAMVHAIYYE